MIDHDIGGRIRRAREQKGLSLGETAGRTKLQTTVLRAIERNDFASLPAGIYRTGYLRVLAAEVGLDPNAMVADYRDTHEAPETTLSPDGQAPVRDRWLEELTTPLRWRAVAMLVVFAALAVAWFLLQRSPPPEARRPSGVAEMSPAEQTPYPDHAQPTSRAVSANPRVETVADRPDVPIRIDMAADDWCWVAADSDGERVIYRLVAPGEHIVVEGERVVAVRLGNAGSITLSINDGARRFLGRTGEVVEIVVTPDNVEGLRDAMADAVAVS